MASRDTLEKVEYRRDHLRARDRRVEVVEQEVHITDQKSDLLRAPVAASDGKSAVIGVSSIDPKRRATVDEDGQYTYAMPR
ncbi:MAG: hypothetical protein AB7U61_13020 [Methylocystis sp.]